MSTDIDLPRHPSAVFFNFLTRRTDANIAVQDFNLRREIDGSPNQTYGQKPIDHDDPRDSTRRRGIPTDEREGCTQDSEYRHDSKGWQEARQIDGNRVQHGDDDAHRGQKIDKKDTGHERADDERKPRVIAEEASGHAGLYHSLPPFKMGAGCFCTFLYQQPRLASIDCCVSRGRSFGSACFPYAGCERAHWR